MSKFKIEMELSDASGRVLLADFDSNSNKNNTITFDEQLTEEENDRFILSFSMPQKVNDFNFKALVRVGRPLWLYFSSPEKSIRMVISSYTVNDGSENSIYNIEAQDYASYVFSKNNVGLTFDTFTDEDFLDWKELNLEGPVIIQHIVDYILQRGFLQSTRDFSGWTLDAIWDEEEESPLLKQINFEASDSNTYNALVEIANIANLELRFDYTEKKVIFINRESVKLNKSYQLKENFNIQNYSKTYSGENLYSLFYVQGSPDEFGLTTIMSDATPYKDNFLIDLEYFKDSGIISPYKYNEILEKFIENGELHEINLGLRQIIKDKYSQLEVINNLWTTILSTSEIMYGDTSNIEIYKEQYKKFLAAFKKTKNETEFKVLSKPFLSKWSELKFDFEVEITGPPDSPDSPTFEPEGNFSLEKDSTHIHKKYLDRETGPSLIYYTDNIESTLTDIGPNNFQYKWNYNSTLITYPIIEALFLYNGDRALDKKENEIQSIVDSYKEDWVHDIKYLECLDTLIYDEDGKLENNSYPVCENFYKPGTEKIKESVVAKLNKNIEFYPNLLGEGEVIGDELISDETTIGRWTHILKYFEKFREEFSSNKTPIMENYRSIWNEKLNFWFELKENLHHIFPEGYFEDQVETSPETLKDKGEIFFKEHKKPQQDFSINYIDASDIVGIELNDIQVGDFVNLNSEINDGDVELKVASISRVLKENSNITLTIYKYNMINKLLEQIIARSQK